MNKSRAGRRLRGLIALAALLIAGSALAATPAQARVPQRTHCVADVTGVRPQACYTTFAAAIRYATGGRVTDAPATAVEAVLDAAFGARLDAAGAASLRAGAQTSNVVISIEYVDSGFGGADQIWTANKGCPDNNLNDVDHSVTSVGWSEDQISSFKGYSNCWVTHFENRNFGGASIGPNSSMSYIGAAMDDRTSSIQWT
jgi:hypothetical protein